MINKRLISIVIRLDSGGRYGPRFPVPCVNQHHFWGLHCGRLMALRMVQIRSLNIVQVVMHQETLQSLQELHCQDYLHKVHLEVFRVSWKHLWHRLRSLDFRRGHAAAICRADVLLLNRNFLRGRRFVWIAHIRALLNLRNKENLEDVISVASAIHGQQLHPLVATSNILIRDDCVHWLALDIDQVNCVLSAWDYVIASELFV